MAIPEYYQIMLPLLDFASDGAEHEVSASRDSLASRLGVSPAERSVLQSAGTGFLFNNRLGWAKTYLTKAGLLERTRQGWFKITQEGIDFLAKKKAKGETSTSWQELDRLFPSLHKWLTESRARAGGGPLASASRVLSGSVIVRAGFRDSLSLVPSGTSVSGAPTSPLGSSSTPEDEIADAIAQLDSKLLDDIESRFVDIDPTAFEILVVKLLVKMRYANSEDDILQLHGFSGDEGIDGRVKRDALGLDQVYVQANRYKSPVTLKPVSKFFEKVNKERTRVGVFVARSGFNKEATEYINESDHQQNIAWINGHRMAELMIQYRVGVNEVQRGRLVLLSIDENAFRLETE